MLAAESLTEALIDIIDRQYILIINWAAVSRLALFNALALLILYLRLSGLKMDCAAVLNNQVVPMSRKKHNLILVYFES